MHRNLQAMSTAALLCVITLACEQGGLPPNPDVIPPSADKIKPVVDTRTRSTVPSTMASSGAAKSATQGTKISGQVLLAAGVTPPAGATLFVIARKAGVKAGPPIAVARLAADQFPAAFELSQSNVMIPTNKFEGEMDITARLDVDGNAMTKGEGDLMGALGSPVAVGTGGLFIEVGGSGGASTASSGSTGAMASDKASSAPVKAASGHSVSGTISLAPGAKVPPGGVLYVMARNPGGGPPVAVARLTPERYPTPFELSKKDVMMSSMPFQGPFMISARLDEDGDAMSKTAGDLLAEVKGEVPLGQGGIEMVLSPR